MTRLSLEIERDGRFREDRGGWLSWQKDHLAEELRSYSNHDLDRAKIVGNDYIKFFVYQLNFQRGINRLDADLFKARATEVFERSLALMTVDDLPVAASLPSA